MFSGLKQPVSFREITLNNGFWANRQELFRDITLDAVYDRFEETGRFASLHLDWKEGQPNKPHIFWESDITKWIEGAAYFLQHHDMPELEARIDELVRRMEQAQGEDGYLNVYFTAVEPEARFARRTDHELYCAGHLIEAGLAYAEATGKERLLDIARRYADLIDRVFRIEHSAAFDTPGHQKIELALMKLYDYTGEQRYLELAKYFINTRGHSERDGTYDFADLKHLQSHLPIREQATAEGHAVRALYQFAGAADVARVTGDTELQAVCDTVFDNIISRRMHITGGVGSTHQGESFTYDYDLPEYTTYNETCASIALMMFCRRLWTVHADRKYADTAELALYNTVLAGISLSGDRFFYENPLAVDPLRQQFNDSRPEGLKEHLPILERVKVFDCSCCPPNLLRLVGSIGDYMYSVFGRTIYTQCYMGGRASFEIGNDVLHLYQETNYPLDGKIRFVIETAAKAGLALRIPSWCEAWTLTLNGEALHPEVHDGYVHIDRSWEPGDRVLLDLHLAPRLYESNPRVSATAGRVALLQGPVVYCAEGIDQGDLPLRDVRIKDIDNYELSWAETSRMQFPTFRLNARCHLDRTALFSPVGAGDNFLTDVTLRLIPYFAWANRGVSEMTVWLLKDTD